MEGRTVSVSKRIDNQDKRQKNINMYTPHEMHIGEVFFPPLVVAVRLGLIAATITGKLLNKYGLSKYFFFPPIAYIALFVIYTIVFGWIIIPF